VLIADVFFILTNL